MKLETTLYKGLVDRNLKVVYSYEFENTGQYPTIFRGNTGKIYMKHSFAVYINQGMDRPNLFIPSNRYFHFTQLLSSTIKLISENLYEIFPDIGKMEFEIDPGTLERFQTEKAMSIGEMTMMPAVWVNPESACFPGLRISTNINNSTITIPFEDAIPISRMFDTFDPITYGGSVLNIVDKL